MRVLKLSPLNGTAGCLAPVQTYGTNAMDFAITVGQKTISKYIHDVLKRTAPRRKKQPVEGDEVKQPI